VSIDYHIKTATSRANKFFAHQRDSLKKSPLPLDQNKMKTLKPSNIQIEDTIGASKGYTATKAPEKKG
jgi:hypothetical protein